MDEKVVLLETKGKIAYITINRPKVLNAINYDVLDGLAEAIDEVEKNNDISVVIIRGSGNKAFVAGADIGILNTFDAFSSKTYCETGQNLFNKIEALGKAVIASINGYTFGGGCELAMACDIRVASEKSKFALPEVTLGVIPGFGGTQRLPRLVGVGNAKQMMFTGKPINAQKAKEIGLVNEVVEEENLDDYCKQLAETIAANSSVAIRFCKASTNEGMQMELHKAIAQEAVQFSVNFTSPDRIEGINAFMEKRKPNFKGLGN